MLFKPFYFYFMTAMDCCTVRSDINSSDITR